MISRVTGSPAAHRILAFCLALLGGHTLGQALRITGARPLLDFGPLYVGSWMIRDGHPWADLYDPVFFSGAVSHVAPAGRILDLGTTPPAVVLLAYPFTAFTADYGKFLFAGSGVLFLLLGLFLLGAGRVLGWNRSEWIALAGIVLGSAAAEDTVLRGGPATWIFGVTAAAVAAHMVGSRWVAAVLSGVAANLGPAGWGPLLFSLWRGPRVVAVLALTVGTVGWVLQAIALGSSGIALFATAWIRSWLRPVVSDPSWAARFGRIGAFLAEEGRPAATGERFAPEVLAALAGIFALGLATVLLRLLFVQLGANRGAWTAADANPNRRPNFDPPRLLGIGPALLVGLFLVAVPEPVRGYGLLWGVPLWASVNRLEARPSARSGLLLLLLAFLLLLPAPLSGWIGPDQNAHLVWAGSVGLVLWWVREFRVGRGGPGRFPIGG